MGALVTKMAKRRKAWWKGLRKAGSHREVIEIRYKDFERHAHPEVGPFCGGTAKKSERALSRGKFQTCPYVR